MMLLKSVMIFWGGIMPCMGLTDRSAMQLPASEKINIWFAMQLPLFVEWPKRSVKQLPKDSQPMPARVVNFCFDIADPQRFFFDEEKESQKNGYKFDIKLIDHISQLNQCHILMIHKSQEYRLSSLLLAIKNKPILTVSDINNFAEKGGMVALFVDRERLHYICNLRVARDSGLKISSRILELADAVYE